LTYVLDASAVLALLNREPGGETVQQRLSQSVMSLVNAVEVATKLVDGGMSTAAAREAMDLLEIAMAEFDLHLAEATVELRKPTRALGLSLADRACLALAIREDATAVTADRIWASVDVGCKIEVIR
jgi:PIN domain nuclease of toxin-antitoxin system